MPVIGYVKTALAVSVGAMVLLAWHHYVGLLHAQETMSANNAVLKNAVAEQQAAYQAARKNIAIRDAQLAQFQIDVDNMRQVSETAAAEENRLNDIFAAHDFTAMAFKKPGLIESKVNAATSEIFNDFEMATAP